MADIGEAIVTQLKTEITVTNLAGTRFRPDELAQGETLPAVAYFVFSEDSETALTGKVGLAQSRVQLDCYATTRSAANELADAIVDKVDGLTGTYTGITVFDCFKDNRYYRVDAPEPGASISRRRVVLDFVINHSEPVPSL
jgi:hypothetical protein